ncbi:MAG: hypothetical protein JWR69_1138 [Pedosphaera sp.]|nr:hypothetical protein [Pedosphaera sp.]
MAAKGHIERKDGMGAIGGEFSKLIQVNPG